MKEDRQQHAQHTHKKKNGLHADKHTNKNKNKNNKKGHLL